MAGTVKLGRILGVELKLDYSWFIIFVLVTLMLAGRHFPMMDPGWPRATYWIVGVVTSLLFFGSVVAHELAHSAVATAVGVPVHDITLFIFGGAARLSREPDRPWDELLIAVVGPVTSAILAALFWALAGATRDSGGPISAVAIWLAYINISLAIFNLLPGFPLDGGRVFRAIIWSVTGNLQKATRVATITGRLMAVGFILWGVWQFFTGYGIAGLWISFIGWFLYSAAAEVDQGVAAHDLLAGHTVDEVMMPDCPRLDPDRTIADVVEHDVLSSGRRCFPVMRDGALDGLLTLHQLKAVPREEWTTTRVRDVMLDRTVLRTVNQDDLLADVLDRMSSEDINQFPVLAGDRFVGVVARDRLLDFIRMRSELTA